jgi:amino acid permease
VRALIVIGTALVAIHTPYFGSVLGTVGGFTDAMQSFVIPPLIFLKLNEGKPFVSSARRWFFRIVFAWGVVLVAGTTFLVIWLLM